MFMLWVKGFYWAGLFEEPAYFVVQLIKTMSAVKGFAALFVIVLFSFASYFFLLQLNLKDGGWVDGDESFNYVEETIGNSYLDAILSMYLLSLGEFHSMDGYSGGFNKISAWIMFIFATIILLLLFMNMIIAVMSEPFEEVKERKLSY